MTETRHIFELVDNTTGSPSGGGASPPGGSPRQPQRPPPGTPGGGSGGGGPGSRGGNESFRTEAEKLSARISELLRSRNLGNVARKLGRLFDILSNLSRFTQRLREIFGAFRAARGGARFARDSIISSRVVSAGTAAANGTGRAIAIRGAATGVAARGTIAVLGAGGGGGGAGTVAAGVTGGAGAAGIAALATPAAIAVIVIAAVAVAALIARRFIRSRLDNIRTAGAEADRLSPFIPGVITGNVRARLARFNRDRNIAGRFQEELEGSAARARAVEFFRSGRRQAAAIGSAVEDDQFYRPFGDFDNTLNTLGNLSLFGPAGLLIGPWAKGKAVEFSLSIESALVAAGLTKGRSTENILTDPTLGFIPSFAPPLPERDYPAEMRNSTWFNSFSIQNPFGSGNPLVTPTFNFTPPK